MKPLCRTALTLMILVSLGATAGAKEVHSNGTGGGPWSDPTTWHDNAVPGPDDDAVIRRDDVVSFDRDDNRLALRETSAAMVGDAFLSGQGPLSACAALLTGAAGKVTCRQLSIDPKGALTFKPGGKRTLCVTGPVEVFGTIKLDARNAARDFLELRLVGDTQEKRTLQLRKGGALLVHGRSFDDGRHNVALTSRPQPALRPLLTDPDALGTVDAKAGAMIDVQRADVVNVLLQPTGIDNTGAKPNERVNIAESRFLERGRVYCNGCDTPVIANNTFAYAGDALITAGAITTYGCSLADIHGNRIRGFYYWGISVGADQNSSVVGNVIERSYNGMYWYGTDGMVKQLRVNADETGILLTSMSGALEDVTIESAKTGLYHGGATAQILNLRVDKIAKGGTAVDYYSGPLTLVNANVRPEQVRINKPTSPPPTRPEFLVQAMDYLVVGTKGEAPADAVVEVTTGSPAKPLPPGAADLNIRNSPARVLRNGLTPLPRTLEPLIVKSWTIDPDGKTIPAPEYDVKILAGAAGPGGQRKLLKTLKVKPQPDWFRSKPNDAVATVEVPIK